ncbi:MAG: ABC transporter substrate-binding protein, partial [bacterium]|nr:ABC transporter substrate-binding protein [bacterium]
MNRRHALSLLGTWSLGCQHSGTRPARRLVKVALRRFPSTAVFYSAYEFGHFDDAGFDIEVVQFRNTNMVVPTLAGGAVDVSLMAMNPGVITAAMRGAAVRIVAGRELASTTCGAAGTVFGRRKSFPNGLDDLRVLKGKRISFSHQASVAEFFADCLLGAVDLTTDDIEPVYLPYAEAVAGLRAGAIDAIIRSQFDKDLTALSDEIVRGPG